MAGIDAFGAVWSVEFTDPTFVAQTQVTSIDVLDAEVDTYDVSSHSSPSKWREFIGGMKDGGELSMEINYDPTLHNALFTAMGLVKQMKVLLPDTGAAEVAFDGIITGFSAEAPFDDKLGATVTVKVTGAIVITL